MFLRISAVTAYQRFLDHGNQVESGVTLEIGGFRSVSLMERNWRAQLEFFFEKNFFWKQADENQ